MHTVSYIATILTFTLSLLIGGCEKSDPEFKMFGRDADGHPLQYRYLSFDIVELNIKGQVYSLDREGPRTPTPFRYRFEDDGDIDVYIDGKAYDIDSPYDIDITIKSAKKEKKKSSKKTTKKSTKKTRKSTKKSSKKNSNKSK